MIDTVAEAPVNPEHILKTGLAFWASKTLLSAVELELFTKLAAQPSTADDLRAQLGIHRRAALDFLDALVALGFLRRDAGVYSNTPATDLFLDKRKPSYVGGILEMANLRLFGFWNNLTDGLKSGTAQNEAKAGGPSPFVEIYADPARLRSFLAAMSGISHGANITIARQFSWSGYKTFVDVGTAQGDLAVQVALANPHMKGTGLDLPVVQPIFEEYASRNGVADRVSLRVGGFLRRSAAEGRRRDDGTHPPRLGSRAEDHAGAEGVRCAAGRRRLHRLRQHHRRRQRQNAFGLLMSLNMLIETPGGFDYTGADCIGWMKDAGFKETRVEHLVGPDSMVVGIK